QFGRHSWPQCPGGLERYWRFTLQYFSCGIVLNLKTTALFEVSLNLTEPFRELNLIGTCCPCFGHGCCKGSAQYNRYSLAIRNRRISQRTMGFFQTLNLRHCVPYGILGVWQLIIFFISNWL